jgi:hypothetical protein
MPARKRAKVYHHVVHDDPELAYDTVRHTQIGLDSRNRQVAKNLTLIQFGYDDNANWVDDDTFALDDPSGHLYDEELARSAVEVATEAFIPATRVKRKSKSPRSAASVSFLCSLDMLLIV